MPAITTVEKKGPGSMALPISSSSIDRSRKLSPTPPYCSGTISPSQPCSAIFCQSSGV